MIKIAHKKISQGWCGDFFQSEDLVVVVGYFQAQAKVNSHFSSRVVAERFLKRLRPGQSDVFYDQGCVGVCTLVGMTK